MLVPYTECRVIGCQCRGCKRGKDIACCIFHPILCPDDRDFDPEYKCPDFTPKEEGGNKDADT